MGLAVELAEKRGVSRQIDAEMLAGMSPAQAKAVHDVVGRQILYTPVVHMKDFDVAVSYLVRRLEENAESQNFLYALFAPDEASDKGKTPMQDQQERFHASVRDRWKTFAGQRRQQDRNNETGRQTPNTGRFINEPDTDPSLRANREWALKLWRPTQASTASSPSPKPPRLMRPSTPQWVLPTTGQPYPALSAARF